MRSSAIVAALALATSVLAAPAKRTTAFADIPVEYLKGFKNPIIESSAGGKALCISGMIDVTVSATNILMKSQEPANDIAVTELLVETFQINSTVSEKLVGGPNSVNGTFGIYSKLCFPVGGSINATTVHFTIHGAGFGREYWDFAPGYSYVDFAAEQGYTTFSYDRLGSAQSDHPDPIQIVQLNIQVSIAHELIQSLRTGGISDTAFEHVVGVGHSLGSFQTVGITTRYPDDLDAAVLTGFSPSLAGIPVAFAGVNLAPAAGSQPLRFSSLANGYLSSGDIHGTQFFFFRAPGFDPALLDLAEMNKQTVTVGEFLTIAKPVVTNFTGPIDVVNGESDFPNCSGNCSLPYNLAAAVKDAFYPLASNGSSWYLAPLSGHGLNLHYSAPGAYEHILDFVKRNGL
ncbi:hypothetical protein LTR85_000381 [Meristemomyces frigidus]|nr:hypothetical protein LTR85_000381 [Meristemomyces frigidus]